MLVVRESSRLAASIRRHSAKASQPDASVSAGPLVDHMGIVVLVRVRVGVVSQTVQRRRQTTYTTTITTVRVTTLCSLSGEANSLIAETGRRATLYTANSRKTAFLYRRISVAIQRFNAVCLANTFTVCEFPS